MLQHQPRVIVHNRLVVVAAVMVIYSFMASALAEGDVDLIWREAKALPNSLGVAGPFVGTHNGVLIVAGGANFPRPVWETSKEWHTDIHVLVKQGSGYVWREGGQLPRPLGYGAAVSTADGIVCIGGNDAQQTYRDVFLLRWDVASTRVMVEPFPLLPKPCAFGAATLVGNVIYLAGGQSGPKLDSAMKNFWTLDLTKRGTPSEFVWQEQPAWPGPTRALNLNVRAFNGTDECVYVISGRRQEGEQIQFLKDVWQYTPQTKQWSRREDIPRCMMAGTAIDYGKSRILVLSGADGTLFARSGELKDRHPGFPKSAFVYHADKDQWRSAGAIPANQVTTIAVKWEGSVVIASGEIRPRVRSPKVWLVHEKSDSHRRRSYDATVVVIVLLALAGFVAYAASER